MEVLLSVANTNLSDCQSQWKLVAACASVPVALAAFGLARRWIRDRRLPPGPTGLPLVGCVRLIDKSDWHRQLLQEGKNYDGIFSFYYGSQLIVVVTSYDLMKEMLESHQFTGRQQTPAVRKVSQGRGIVLAEGAVWSHHRRLSLRILRDFGFARAETLEMIDTSMEPLIRSLDVACDNAEPVKLLDEFLAVSNGVIAQLLFGRRFTREEEAFVEFCDAAFELLKLNFLTPLDMFPILYEVVLRLPVADKMVNVNQRMNDFIKKAISERQILMEAEGAEPACLCDVYLLEKRKAEKRGDADTYCDQQLIRTCFEFFLAGTDTTARSVEWLLLFMAFHPDKQQRIHEELDSVVGQSRQPRMTDKSSLHFLNAVIDESYRKASLLSLGVYHRATDDTTFHGFTIPKEALILPHVYAVHHDDKFWNSPDLFMPERFLDSAGHYRQCQRVIPFLIGKRACLGESLARIEVFLMFSTIMHRYRVCPTPESLRRREEIFDGTLGLLNMPGDYKLEFVRRMQTD